MSSAFHPQRRSLHDQVRDHLAERIAAGAYAPGEALPPERELAGSLGISRHSLRQALASLASMGILEIRHGSGVYLAKSPTDEAVTRVADALFGPRDLLEVLEARLVVEPGIASLAAERCTPEDVHQLQRSLAVDPDDLHPVGEGGFHRELARLARNPVLDGLLRSCLTGPRGVSMLAALAPDASARWASDHALICAAVSRSDAVTAATVMQRHLADVVAIARAHAGPARTI